MNENKNEIIMYDSNEAAEYRTNISGWVSRDGRFFGEDEHLARWNGCTHKKCNCGNVIEYSRCECDSCYAKKVEIKYSEMPFKEWDGETPLLLYNDDHFFFSQDDIEDFCEENECEVSRMKFVICEKNTVAELDIWDHIHDIMPEDHDDPPTELQKIFDIMNERIREFNKTNTISWEGGNYRTSIDSLQLNKLT